MILNWHLSQRWQQSQLPQENVLAKFCSSVTFNTFSSQSLRCLHPLGLPHTRPVPPDVQSCLTAATQLPRPREETHSRLFCNVSIVDEKAFSPTARWPDWQLSQRDTGEQECYKRGRRVKLYCTCYGGHVLIKITLPLWQVLKLTRAKANNQYLLCLFLSPFSFEQIWSQQPTQAFSPIICLHPNKCGGSLPWLHTDLSANPGPPLLLPLIMTFLLSVVFIAYPYSSFVFLCVLSCC